MPNRKTVFPKEEQEKVLQKLRRYIDEKVLPDESIKEIIVSGSLTTKELGKYEKFIVKPFYRRLYSDIDLGIHADKGFRPKREWEPFSKGKEFDSYRLGVLDKKFQMIALVHKKPMRMHKTDIVLYRREE